MAERRAQTGTLLPAVATLATATLLLLAPVAPDPTLRALGRACSEAPDHLWQLWATADRPLELLAVPQVGPPPGGPLADPANLLVFWPMTRLVGGAAGAVLAWNLVHVLAVLLGGVGTMALGLRLGLRGWSLGLLTACVVGSPALLHHPELGRSECLLSLLLPLVLVGVWDSVHQGRSGRGWLAGVLLGLVMSSGPTVALFSAPVVLVLAGRWSHGLPPLPRLRAVLPVVVIGVLGGLLALQQALGAAEPGLPHAALALAAGTPASGSIGALVGLGAPGPTLRHTLALGTLPLLLAGLGVARGPQNTAVWATLAGVLALLGLGPTPTLGDHALVGPAALLTALAPVLAASISWAQAGWVLALPLGVAAAWGTTHLGRHLRWMGPLLIVAVLADHARFPPPRGENRGSAWFTVAPSAALRDVVDALPPGRLLAYPADPPAPLQETQCRPRGVWRLWAQALGTTVQASGPAPAASGAARPTVLADLRADPAAVLARLQRAPVPPACMRTELEAQQARGGSAVVVDHRLPGGSAAQRALELALGPPHRTEGAVSAWSIAHWLAAAGPRATEICP